MDHSPYLCIHRLVKCNCQSYIFMRQTQDKDNKSKMFPFPVIYLFGRCLTVLNTVPQPMVGSAVGFNDLINNKHFPKIRGYSKIHYLEKLLICTIFLCGSFILLPYPYHFCQCFHLKVGICFVNYWSHFGRTKKSLIIQNDYAALGNKFLNWHRTKT